MSAQMQKIVDALAAGLDAAIAELGRTKQAFGYNEAYAYRWRGDAEDVALIESALTAARVMRDAEPVAVTWLEGGEREFREWNPRGYLLQSLQENGIEWQTLYTAPPPTAASEGPQPPPHIGDSSFDAWHSVYNPAGRGDEQRARDAYAAGMSDPLVATRPALSAALCPCKDRQATECPGEWEQGCDLGANEKHARRVES